MTQPIFHRQAERELLKSIDLYEAKVRGLGGQFLERVIQALEQIQAFPESCPVLSGRARKRPLRQFPYSVIYSIDPSGIFILAIAHQKRRADYWKDRL
ncbi:MAG: type II toxin-antitoxin system RelE/ParE family toxin [Acidobacteriota bacterium]